MSKSLGRKTWTVFSFKWWSKDNNKSKKCHKHCNNSNWKWREQINISTNVFGSDGLNPASLKVHDSNRNGKNEENKTKIENHLTCK